jgi:hypothetical protein
MQMRNPFVTIATMLALAVASPVIAKDKTIVTAKQQQAEDLSGMWQGESDSAQAVTLIHGQHAAFLVVQNGQKPFAGPTPTENEMAVAYKMSVAATLKFFVPAAGKWEMEYINSTDPSLKGTKVKYEYIWLNKEKSRMQFWVLDADGGRTAETGISRRIG